MYGLTFGLLAMCCWTAPERPAAPPAMRGVVTETTVSVRGQPHQLGFVTHQLNQGDVVEIVGEQRDFVAIKPPAGTFLLIPQTAVATADGRTGTIKDFAVDTQLGCTLAPRLFPRGPRLPRNTPIEILEPAVVMTPRGPEHFFKIVPVNDTQYLPKQAVMRDDQVLVARYFQPGPMDLPPDMNPQVVHQLRQADEAYRQGIRTGDWTEAERQYEALAKTTSDNDARTTALNRLEFIRWHRKHQTRDQRVEAGQGRPRVAPPPDQVGWRPTDRRALPGPGPQTLPPPEPGRGPTGAMTTSNPPAPPGPTQTAAGPTSPPVAGNRFNAPEFRNPTPDTQRAGLPTSRPTSPTIPSMAPPGQTNVGYIHQAIQSDLGKPVYYLTNSTGMLLFYFHLQPGMDVWPYIQARTPVQVTGGPLVYRPDFKAQYRQVTDVKPLKP